jgi:hypothetical protein
METSSVPVKDCEIKAYAQGSWPLSREGFFVCHTCCDVFPVHPKGHPTQPPLTTNKEYRGSILTRSPRGLAMVTLVTTYASENDIIAFEWLDEEIDLYCILQR